MAGYPQIPFPHITSLSQYFTADFKDIACLLPTEAAIVQQSSEKRRADFSTGRYCAHQALAALKADYKQPILQGPGKQPVWPDGFVGSISHSAKLSGAVVAAQNSVIAVGLDIETIGGVQADMWDLLFHPDEQALIRSKQTEVDAWATTLFSLKESFYKLQYPLTGKFLDFKELIIRHDGGRFCFTVTQPLYDLSPVVLSSIQVQWVQVTKQIITLCYIAA